MPSVFPRTVAGGYVSVALKTAQGAYTMFRHIIYVHTMAQPHGMILAGEIEMDESMYDGHGKGKRGWRAAGKRIVLGLYQREGQVMTSAKAPIILRFLLIATPLFFKILHILKMPSS